MAMEPATHLSPRAVFSNGFALSGMPPKTSHVNNVWWSQPTSTDILSGWLRQMHPLPTCHRPNRRHPLSLGDSDSLCAANCGGIAYGAACCGRFSKVTSHPGWPNGAVIATVLRTMSLIHAISSSFAMSAVIHLTPPMMSIVAASRWGSHAMATRNWWVSASFWV